MRREKNIKSAAYAIIIGGLLVTGIIAYAQHIGPSGLLSMFNSSWTQFQANGSAKDGIIEPKIGEQELKGNKFSKGNKLSPGLQAGNRNYYAGDLTLSFDENASEYAVDFGQYTKDYVGDKGDAGSGSGIAPAGFYKDVSWNSDIYHASSSSFAWQSNTAGSGAFTPGTTSYYSNITHDPSQISGGVIDGSLTVTPAPEPATMLLFGAGLIGLGSVIRKRNKK